MSHNRNTSFHLDADLVDDIIALSRNENASYANRKRSPWEQRLDVPLEMRLVAMTLERWAAADDDNAGSSDYVRMRKTLIDEDNALYPYELSDLLTDATFLSASCGRQAMDVMVLSHDRKHRWKTSSAHDGQTVFKVIDNTIVIEPSNSEAEDKVWMIISDFVKMHGFEWEEDWFGYYPWLIWMPERIRKSDIENIDVDSFIEALIAGVPLDVLYPENANKQP